MNIFSVFRPTDGGIEAYNQLQGIKEKQSSLGHLF